MDISIESQDWRGEGYSLRHWAFGCGLWTLGCGYSAQQHSWLFIRANPWNPWLQIELRMVRKTKIICHGFHGFTRIFKKSEWVADKPAVAATLPRHEAPAEEAELNGQPGSVFLSRPLALFRGFTFPTRPAITPSRSPGPGYVPDPRRRFPGWPALRPRDDLHRPARGPPGFAPHPPGAWPRPSRWRP